MNPAQAALQAGVDRVSAEAAGALTIEVIQPHNMPNLLAAMISGDQRALNLVTAVKSAIDGVAAAPRKRPMLCATCDRALRVRDGFAVAVAMPDSSQAKQALGIGICRHCATDPGDLLACARTAFRRIWPQLREITVTHPDGGRA